MLDTDILGPDTMIRRVRILTRLIKTWSKMNTKRGLKSFIFQHVMSELFKEKSVIFWSWMRM